MITREAFELRFRNRINDELMLTLDDDYPDKQEDLTVEISQELFADGIILSPEDEDRLFLWVCEYKDEEVDSIIQSWKE